MQTNKQVEPQVGRPDGGLEGQNGMANGSEGLDKDLPEAADGEDCLQFVIAV